MSPDIRIDSLPIYRVVEPLPLEASSIRLSVLSAPMCNPVVVKISPATWSLSVGAVVPMPRLPPLDFKYN